MHVLKLACASRLTWVDHMAPKKKAATSAQEISKRKPGNTHVSSKKPKKDDTALSHELATAVHRCGAEVLHKNYVKMLLDEYDRNVNAHGSLVHYLQNEYDTVEKRQQLAHDMSRAFPLLEGVPYAKDLRPGKKNLALWMCGWHPLLGNKGFMQSSETKILLQLIIIDAFNTDADNLPGVEKLVVAPVIQAYFKNEKYETGKLTGHKSLLGFGEVAYVKGWSRAVVALWVGAQILKNNLIDEVHDQAPKLFGSLQLIHGLVSDKYMSEEAQIKGNAGWHRAFGHPM